MLDFGALTPEINSTRMYAGPGAGPMLLAAAAWGRLAADLQSAAAAYRSVIAGLTTGPWLGAAASSMALAAATFSTWINTVAAQVEETASQAAAAAAAFAEAFLMTVPPAVVAANRALLMSLIATNILGQNTPAIAATEAHYSQMWAQDAAAMYGYAANSAAASQVTPFTPPQPNTNPGGQAGQTAAVAQATGTGVQTTLSQAMSAVPNTLQGLASPAASGGFGWLQTLLNFLDGADGNAIGTFLNSTFVNGFTSSAFWSPAVISPAVTSALGDIGFLSVLGPGGAGINPALLLSAGEPLSGTGALGVGQLASAAAPLGPAGVGGPAISAGMGRAATVGALSVPHGWVGAAPPASPVATSLPTAGWTMPQIAAEELPGMPGMPGMPGVPVANSTRSNLIGAPPRYGFRPAVVAHPPAAG